MANISRNFHQDLTCARREPRAATKPVIVTSLTKAVMLSKMPGASASVGTVAATLEYEVFCPNCGRVEVASPGDQLKHKCNCGYGVYVEMLRTSPN
jgi:hypothetical protein